VEEPGLLNLKLHNNYNNYYYNHYYYNYDNNYYNQQSTECLERDY